MSLHQLQEHVIEFIESINNDQLRECLHGGMSYYFNKLLSVNEGDDDYEELSRHKQGYEEYDVSNGFMVTITIGEDVNIPIPEKPEESDKQESIDKSLESSESQPSYQSATLAVSDSRKIKYPVTDEQRERYPWIEDDDVIIHQRDCATEEEWWNFFKIEPKGDRRGKYCRRFPLAYCNQWKSWHNHIYSRNKCRKMDTTDIAQTTDFYSQNTLTVISHPKDVHYHDGLIVTQSNDV